MLISIIVPIFKVEPYLRQCVDSLVNQTYRDLEIILVDDGSPDACPQICDGYAKTDSRIQVIHKDNGGLSSARNAGLQIATGEYVLFVDGDDWIGQQNAVENLAQRALRRKPDVISFAYTKVFEETGNCVECLCQNESMPDSYNTKEDQLQYLSERGLYIASAWNKLIRLSCIIDNAIFFPHGKTSEDIAWCLKLMLASRSLDYCNENLYRYRQRTGSISQMLSYKNCVYLTEQIEECAILAEKTGEPCALSFTAYQIATFVKVQTFSEMYPKDCVERLLPYSNILRYHMWKPKLMGVRFMTLLFGFRLSCRIIYMVLHTLRGVF